MLDPDSLTPESLASAVDKAAMLEKQSINFDLEGASKTASIIKYEFEKFKRSAC